MPSNPEPTSAMITSCCLTTLLIACFIGVVTFILISFNTKVIPVSQMPSVGRLKGRIGSEHPTQIPLVTSRAKGNAFRVRQLLKQAEQRQKDAERSQIEARIIIDELKHVVEGTNIKDGLADLEMDSSAPLKAANASLQNDPLTRKVFNYSSEIFGEVLAVHLLAKRMNNTLARSSCLTHTPSNLELFQVGKLLFRHDFLVFLKEEKLADKHRFLVGMDNDYNFVLDEYDRYLKDKNKPKLEFHPDTIGDLNEKLRQRFRKTFPPIRCMKVADGLFLLTPSECKDSSEVLCVFRYKSQPYPK